MTSKDVSAIPSTPPPAPFVVGVGRSGTTLLRLMLDAHPALAIPTETHFLPALLDAARGDLGVCVTTRRAVQAVIRADTWPNMGVEQTLLVQAFDAIDPFTPAEAARAFYRLYAARFGKQRWGDKTPPYRQCMVEIARDLPEAHFIHLIRDGRDVALSYRGLWFGPGDNIDAQARFWVGEIARTREQATRLPHYMEVRYEDLLARPVEVLSDICRFIDLPFDSAMTAYHQTAQARLAEYVQPFGPPEAGAISGERFLSIHQHTSNPPDSSRSGRWRSRMAPDELRRFEAIAGSLLIELGYELGV